MSRYRVKRRHPNCPHLSGLPEKVPFLEVLREGGEVLVLKLGRDLYEELSLLEQVRWAYPETHIVVAAVADYPELTGFIWELGAHFVLMPPIEPDHLREIVTGLMKKGG